MRATHIKRFWLCFIQYKLWLGNLAVACCLQLQPRSIVLLIWCDYFIGACVSHTMDYVACHSPFTVFTYPAHHHYPYPVLACCVP